MPDVFTVDGETITIPVEVRSATMVAAQFLVDADAAQRVIDYSGLRIARPVGDRAMLALSAVAYADNDLGPYHEFAIAFVVEPHDARPGEKPSWKRPDDVHPSIAGEPRVHVQGRQRAVGLPEVGVRDRVPRSAGTNRVRGERER